MYMQQNKTLPIFTFFLIFIFKMNSISAQEINHWEMLVFSEDIWTYFPGVSEPPAAWAPINFVDSAWDYWSGGIGDGDNDDGTIINQVNSVYIRTSFNLTDTSVISWGILHVDYDDAFVAYLNGNEIARANIGQIGIPPLFNQNATDQHEAQMYTGGLPERFIIHKDTLDKYMIEGNNILAIQANNINPTSSDLSSTSFFTLGIEDESSLYRTIPDWFTDPFEENLNLPVLIIDTWGQTIGNEIKITANLKVVDNGPGQLNNFYEPATGYDSFIGIEIRGQSSQMFPKKSYSIETRDELGDGIDVSLLDLPLEEDWVLYAPYSDKTMLRNAISYHLGRKMGNWQPRYKFCEVYLNGSYLGVYMLIEKIKRDVNRLDISKLNDYEISGDDLTGGYIVKVDKIQDLSSQEYFYTYPINHYNNARNYAFTYVYPDFDDIVPEQKTYLQNYLLDLENTLNGSSFEDPVNGFKKYMDIGSFIDFQIINELSNNVDGYRYSTYFYKKKDSKGGKIHAGPLWDFNLGYGNVDYSDLNLSTDQWLYLNYGPYEYHPMHWWARLMEDGSYGNAFADRWQELRAGPFHTDSIMDFINDTILYIGPAVNRNFERWPILDVYVWPNSFVGSTYSEDVNFFKNWLNSRLEWMDSVIPNFYNSVESIAEKNTMNVFPNPLNNKIKINLNLNYASPIDLQIVDMLGQTVLHIPSQLLYSGKQTISFDIPSIKSGYYILKLIQNNKTLTTEKLIVNK